jgi:hypothetical protein
MCVASMYSVALVGIPLPTMMHKRVAVAGAPPSNVVISKNETDQVRSLPSFLSIARA